MEVAMEAVATVGALRAAVRVAELEAAVRVVKEEGAMEAVVRAAKGQEQAREQSMGEPAEHL